jgi:hypothetical protein
VPVGCALHGAGQLVERLGRRGRPLRRDELVRAREAEEADGCMAVLALERAKRQLRPHGGRDRLREVEAPEVGEGLEARLGRRRRLEQQAALLRRPERLPVELRGRLGAHEDVAGFGGGLHLDRPRGGRPGDEELPVGVADEEEVQRAAVDPDVHT